jgi:predicted dithiol-disulfide oxidoreductase (DUF899 family)
MHDDPKPHRPLEHLQFPGEDSTYRTARNALLDEEIALRRQIERVSAQRRALPPGGLVREDYVFEGLDRNRRPAQMKLSELFAPGKDSLAIYSFMYGMERDQRPRGAAISAGARVFVERWSRSTSPR